MILNEKIWELVSEEKGKTFRSIKTEVPRRWVASNVGGQLVRTSGPYAITRRPYGQKAYTYQLTRNGHVLESPDYNSLRAAKQHAQQNARGEDVRHVA